MTNALPVFVADADWTVVGALGAVTTLDRATIRQLVRQVDAAYLKALVRSEPGEGFELLLGEDVASLGFAGRRLAVVSTEIART